MADNATAANTMSDLDMKQFSSEDQWFGEYTRSINQVPQSDIAPQNLVDNERGQDTVSPSTLTAQTPVPASLPMDANTSICQSGPTSTLLPQSVTFADASNSRTFVAQRPTTAQTLNSSISQPYAPQPHGSHGPTRTTPGRSRSQPFPIPTYMQHPAYAHGQQSFETQLPAPGSLQMQQPGHGHSYEPSPREMMQPASFSHRPIYPQFIGPSNGYPQMEYTSSSDPYEALNMMQGLDVNEGYNYPQFNDHMNDDYQMQSTACGSPSPTFLEPQDYFNLSSQMPGQTYPHQAGEQQQPPPPQNYFNLSSQMPGQTYPHQAGEQQQQIAPRQSANPGLDWIPGMPNDLNEMMMQVLLQHIVSYRTRFKQVLQNEFPTSFAKCIRIRFKADYVINFSMACKLCNSHNISFASETRKYQFTDEMDKRENLKMIVEWGTELWHFCQNCSAQWNVFSPVQCRYWGEYLAVDLGQGPNSNAPYHHEPRELLSQNAVHLEQKIQQPVQSTGQSQQPVQESTELQITGHFASQEPFQESAQVTMPGSARVHSDGEINHHGSSSQDTVQGPNEGFGPISLSRLNQPPEPNQEHAEQQTREQAVSINPAATPSSLQNGIWRPQGQQEGEEADEDFAKGTTQIQGTCRDFDVSNGQKSAAKGPQSKAIGRRRTTTQNATKKSTSRTAPPVEPSDSRPTKRQREL